MYVYVEGGPVRPKYGPGDLLTVRRGSWTFLLLTVHPSGDIHPIDQVERLEEGETVLVLALQVHQSRRALGGRTVGLGG